MISAMFSWPLTVTLERNRGTPGRLSLERRSGLELGKDFREFPRAFAFQFWMKSRNAGAAEP
jgi:hypothetical protein